MSLSKTKTIYIDGVFDLFHIGHVNMFINAIKLTKEENLDCEVILIAGVVSDEDAISYKRKPILTYDERSSIVKSCKHVNKVIPAVLVLTEEFLEENNIDLVFHGDDDQQEKFFKIPRERGIMRYQPYTQGISTTDIINRCYQSKLKFST